MSKKLICLISFVLVLGLATGLVSTAQAEPKYVIFLIGDGMGFEQVSQGEFMSMARPVRYRSSCFPTMGN